MSYWKQQQIAEKRAKRVNVLLWVMSYIMITGLFLAIFLTL